MGAKEIQLKPISAQDANKICKLFHYSGKVVNNSSLHIGVFYQGRCEGVMQFGSPLDKRKVLGLVSGTSWNGMLELNRMAFSDRLPKNSESRALSVAFRLIKKHYPHIDWILSFSDATQCGDGAIYRAAGFWLTGIRKNKTILQFPSGEIISDMGLKFSPESQIKLLGGVYIGSSCLKKAREIGAKPLEGFQLRYIFPLNASVKERLQVEIIPFSKIADFGARMYKGIKIGVKSSDSGTAVFQTEWGGANPTFTHQD
jgi:hypothetical protein